MMKGEHLHLIEKYVCYPPEIKPHLHKSKERMAYKTQGFSFFFTQSLFVSFWTENGSELVASLSAVIANVDWQRLGGNPF